MAEAVSVTTFVMGERLPWPDDAHATEARGPFDAGVIFDSGLQRACSVRRISALGATLRGEGMKAPGDEVALELVTGQRPAGTVEWVRGGEAGIRFKQPVDVLALINRKLVAQPVERRTMPRVELSCGVRLKWSGAVSTALMRNISARGLQLEGEGLPPADTYLSVFVDGLNIPPGEVVWRRGDLAGVELLEELSWTSIMPWIREVSRKTAPGLAA